MSKLAPYVFSMLLAAFVVGVAAAVLYYSWNALGIIFPGDLLGQAFGIMLFDVAAFIWFGTFIYLSRSTFQYIWAGAGFIIGLIGALGLIVVEVGLNSGMFAQDQIVKPLTYIFIGVLFGHLVLVYLRHAAAPEVSADISIGVDKAKITEEAQKKAEKRIDQNLDALSNAIGDDIFRQVVKDLRLTVQVSPNGNVPEFTMLESPKVEAASPAPNFLSFLPPSWVNAAKKWNTNAASAEDHLSAVTPKPSPAPLDVESAEVEESKPKKK